MSRKPARLTARLSNEGTDQNMIRNFLASAKTGRLKGRQETLTRLDRFGNQAPRGAILKHIVERVILDPSLSPAQIPAGDSGSRRQFAGFARRGSTQATGRRRRRSKSAIRPLVGNGQFADRRSWRSLTSPSAAETSSSWIRRGGDHRPGRQGFRRPSQSRGRRQGRRWSIKGRCHSEGREGRRAGQSQLPRRDGESWL